MSGRLNMRQMSRAWPLDTRLTQKEGSVAILIYKGYTNKRMAKVFGNMEPTIKMHVISILNKLVLDNRAAIAGYVGLLIGKKIGKRDAFRNYNRQLTLLNERCKDLQSKIQGQEYGSTYRVQR